MMEWRDFAHTVRTGKVAIRLRQNRGSCSFGPACVKGPSWTLESFLRIWPAFLDYVLKTAPR